MSRLTTVGESSAALSRELADFMIELSIGLHKNAIYPPGHPLLEGATQGIGRRLDSLLSERSTLSLGVARHQLIIEGVATDENNPVLRDLAQRLHRHHLGAVKFSKGVTPAEIEDVLSTVAVDAGRRSQPLGLEGPDTLQRWEHIRLYPLTFEQLQLLDEDPDTEEQEDKGEMRGDRSRSAQLWIGLARAALAAETTDERLDDAESADPVVVAKAIDEHKKDAAYDQVVVGYLLQIAEELKSKSGKEAAALQKRISRLVASLQPATLGRLLEMGGDFRQRKRFVADAAQGMAVDAVVELVQAAANSSGQTISHSLVRMLSKLAVHADEGAPLARGPADVALRDQVQQLIGEWDLDDPNPDGYRLALEKMARSAPNFNPTDDAYPCEPERLLHMGIEIQVLGDPVWRSLEQLATRADVTPLLDLLDAAPTGWMQETLWRQVANQDRLYAQLEREPISFGVVQRLVTVMQASAIDPLLDGLERADDRTGASLLDLLASLGPQVAPYLVQRLAGARWTLQRQLLVLMGKLGDPPAGFSVREFVRHPDGLVRREAIRMMLRSPETRDAAIVTALADTDERIVRLAIAAAMTNCPSGAASLLMARADDSALSPDVRALGIRALSSRKSPETVAFLLKRTAGKKRFLRRQALASKSPEMLASLAGLALHWSSDASAAAVIAAAAQSSDPEIADAVARRGGST
ncbi:MAG: HEAT repeat domain-containing protein [Gemmatimonadetes bacterium]|nr:HEAT repeat domain-containing protein [Gemmatimonadota bacterium]